MGVVCKYKINLNRIPGLLYDQCISYFFFVKWKVILVCWFTARGLSTKKKIHFPTDYVKGVIIRRMSKWDKFEIYFLDWFNLPDCCKFFVHLVRKNAE